MRKITRLLLAIVFAFSQTIYAVVPIPTVQNIFNPFTGRMDFIVDYSSNTLPTGSTNYVQVRETLQSGATFFVSSGTVNSQLITGTIGINESSPDAMLEIVTNATTEEGLHIKGSASQTGSLMIMTDSSDNIFLDSGDGLTGSTVKWNEQGVDIDFIIEGENVGALFFTNADQDQVIIAPQGVRASAANAFFQGFIVSAVLQLITGATNITNAVGFNLVEFARPTLSAASALTITNAATLYIDDAPIGSGDGPATITNPYAIWIDSGTSRFDGRVGINEVAPDAMLEIATFAASEEGLHIKGTASQTGSLFTMTDESDNIFFDSGHGLAGSTVTWNEQGADIDHRWEGDTEQNLLFMDAGNNRMGFKTATPGSELEINSSIRITGDSSPIDPVGGAGLEIYYDSDGKAGSGGGGAGLLFLQNVDRGAGNIWSDYWIRGGDVQWDVDAAKTVTMQNGKFNVFGVMLVEQSIPSVTINVTADTSEAKVLFKQEGSSKAAFLYIATNHADTTRRGNMEFNHVDQSGGIGAIAFLTNASKERMRIARAGPIGIGTSDSDAMLEIETSATTEEALHLKGSASQTGSLMIMTDSSDNIFFNSGDGLASSAVVWNEQGANIDFRVEGDTEANLLFVDGQNNRVGIGTNSPSKLFHVVADFTNTDGVRDPIRLERTTSGTPAAGIGIGISFSIEDLGGSEEQAAIDVVLNDVTDGSEDISMNFSGQVAGTITELLDLGSTATIFNETGASIDFRVEGNTTNDLLKIDAGLDFVGISEGTPTSTLDVNGSLSMEISSRTVSYTATSSDHVILASATAAGITIPLPALSGIDGRIYHIKKIDPSTGTVTVDPSGSELIEQALTATLTVQGESISIAAHPIGWQIF